MRIKRQGRMMMIMMVMADANDDRPECLHRSGYVLR